MRKFLLLAVLLGGCGSVDHQTVTLAKPIPIGQPQQAGVGDTVLDLKITEPLPNIIGKADLFGRTRDAGRVIVRYLGERGGEAYFSRQTVTIQNNDTTMSRSGTFIPNVQQTTTTGNVGLIPVSAQQTTIGAPAYIPPGPSDSMILANGAVVLSAPPGGELLVEGRRVTILRATSRMVEYSVR